MSGLLLEVNLPESPMTLNFQEVEFTELSTVLITYGVPLFVVVLSRIN